MKILSSTNSYKLINNKDSINFKSRDYFLKIKQLPNMTCGCCGKEVLNVDSYVKTISTLSKPLSYILKIGKLDYTQKYFPEAWKTLLDFAKKYPEQTLDQILEQQENYVKLKVDITNQLDDPTVKENTKERSYLDRRIGGRFFDLLARARSVMTNSKIIIGEFIHLKPYLHGLKKEVFEQLEEYSKIYPDMTLSEIIKTVARFHDENGTVFKQEKINAINETFNNIEILTSERDIEICKMQNEKELKDTLSEEISNINKKMQYVRDRIWTEKIFKQLLTTI